MGPKGHGPTTVLGAELDESTRTLTLRLSDGGHLEVAADASEALGLGPGSVLDAGMLTALRTAAARKVVARALLRLLDRRPRCRHDLRERLLGKGHPPEAVDAVLDGAATQGLIDDRAFARAWAHDQLLRRSVGRRWLLSRLRQQGVGDSEARDGVDEVLDADEERSLARRALARRRLDLESERERARGLRFLLGRGFEQSTALDAISRLRSEASADSRDEADA